MIKHWKKSKLEDVITIKYGKDHKLLQQGNIPVYGSGGIIRYINKSLYEDVSILIPRKGSLNNIFYMYKPFWTCDTMFYTIIDKNKILPKFLYYQLKLFDFSTLNVGSAIPSLTVPVINDIEIQIPDLSTQKRIAEILSGYDDLIENNLKQISLLEESAARLYKHFFSSPKKDNGKGESNGQIKDIAKLLSGFAFKTKDFTEQGQYKIVTIKNVQDGYFDGKICNKIATIPSRMPEHCILKEGDLLLSLTGNVGRMCIVYGKNYLLNQRVAKLSTKYKAYSYCLFRSKEIVTELNNMANGSAQQNLSPIRTENFAIHIPPTEQIEQFEQLVNPIIDKIILLNKSIELYRKSRDLLLPKLMSGELQV